MLSQGCPYGPPFQDHLLWCQDKRVLGPSAPAHGPPNLVLLVVPLLLSGLRTRSEGVCSRRCPLARFQALSALWRAGLAQGSGSTVGVGAEGRSPLRLPTPQHPAPRRHQGQGVGKTLVTPTDHAAQIPHTGFPRLLVPPPWPTILSPWLRHKDRTERSQVTGPAPQKPQASAMCFFECFGTSQKLLDFSRHCFQRGFLENILDLQKSDKSN